DCGSIENLQDFLAEPIDFLLPRLLCHHPDRAQEYFNKITEQREAGLWGDTELDFYQWFVGSIQNGKLPEEVSRREHMSDSEGDVNLRPLWEKDDPLLIMQKADLLQRAMLWIGTFLPELSPGDFEKALRLLTDEALPNAVERQKVWRRWQQNSHELLVKCRLRFVPLDG